MALARPRRCGVQARGSRIALVGENGAGKTTLLRLAAGRLEPDRGSVALNGVAELLPQHLPERPDVPGSGGEVQRRRLEALLARSADLLLLDEPTHHLDVDALAWLEQSLLHDAAAVLFVSHDRAFLDAVATGSGPAPSRPTSSTTAGPMARP